jgi:sugar lactone lactonase YvrE
METLVQGGKNGVVLDAPKGMALHGDTLWVADIDQLRGFDRHSGAPLATIDLRPQHAVLLNDVAVGPDGSIHVTDTGILMTDKGVIHPGGDKIFVIGPNRAISLQATGAAVGWPNGITWDAKGKRWIVVTFDPFHSTVNALRDGDTTHAELGAGVGRFDGVEVLDDGRLLVTCWNDSSVHLFGSGADDRIVRHLSQPADLGLDTRRHRIAVPLGMLGRVEFWQLPASAAGQVAAAR